MTSDAPSAHTPRIVTHFVAGYPDFKASLDVARGLIAGGAFALEMQIPFSDPSADGPVIEEACRAALDGGFRVEDAWKLLEAVRSESDIPVFVMSYASLAVAPGIEAFVRRVRHAGADGLIIPDLVPGADEGLFAAAAEAGCPAVPVIVPSVTDARLEEVFSERFDWVYVALRSGITGTYTELGGGQDAFLKRLRKRCETSAAATGRPGRAAPRIMAGFGIQSPEQVRTVAALADAAIVGSALVRAVAQGGTAGAGEAARNLLLRLRGL
jgi:tryptophan synthase alpha chain